MCVGKCPRTTCEYGNHVSTDVHMCKHSYSTVDVNEQRNMVNSGVRGTKNNHLMIEMDCIYYLSYRNLVPSTGNLHYWCSRRLRRFGLRWCSLGPLRTRAGSILIVHSRLYTTLHRRQHSAWYGMLCRGSREGRRRGGEKEGRGNGGRGEGSRSDCWW
jgi:hypothetical protein